MEGALEDPVEARFVAVQQPELGLGGQRGEAGSDAGELAARFRRLGGDGVVHELCFDGPSAALTPQSGYHFLDETALDGIGGIEAFGKAGREGIEALAGLGFKDNTACKKPVADGVCGRALFPGRGNRPLGPGAIGAGGKNSP
jgi:hypothetical protein